MGGCCGLDGRSQWWWRLPRARLVSVAAAHAAVAVTANAAERAFNALADVIERLGEDSSEEREKAVQCARTSTAARQSTRDADAARRLQ